MAQYIATFQPFPGAPQKSTVLAAKSLAEAMDAAEAWALGLFEATLDTIVVKVSISADKDGLERYAITPAGDLRRVDSYTVKAKDLKKAEKIAVMEARVSFDRDRLVSVTEITPELLATLGVLHG